MKHEKSLQTFFDNQVVGMMEVDAEGRYLQVNNQWSKMIGYSVTEIMSKDFQSVTHPDDLPRQLLLDKELVRGKINSYRIDKRYIRKDGSIFWGDVSVTGLYDNRDILTGMVGLVIDITEQKISEDKLRKTEELQRTLLEASPDVICFKDADGRWLLANKAMLALFQLEETDYQGKTDAELAQYNSFYSAAFLNCALTSEKSWSAKGISIIEEVIPSQVSEERIYEFIKSPLFHPDGSRKALVILGRDITARKRTEDQLQQLATAIEQVGEIIIITDIKGTIEYVNPAFTVATGYSNTEAIGQNPSILNSGEQADSVYSELWESITQGRTWKGRLINKKKDGNYFTEDATISPIFNSAGTIVNFVAAKRDITEQLLTEEKYRHAQKMEAMGQLAGGVAHDFNNMLAIILGQVEIALLKILPDNPLKKRLQEIKIAANRSSNLTQQLLGFARKQSRQSQILNLSDTVATMLTMLKHLIGEQLELRWSAEAELPLVDIDPGHFDQILTNLIINARDAIDGAGVISVKTRQVLLDETFCQNHPGSRTGEYILLDISDSGCGMSQEVLDKIFDPFFTTKEIGKGTGLGLSMVFGLIKQNNGYIIVNSTPEQGSTFSLYFPRIQIKEEPSIHSDNEILLDGTETILVVEDETALLDITTSMLTESGYRVLSAQGPFAAIQLAEKYKEPIHLLLTDIVMPKMNGVELSDYLIKIEPEIKVLYMSGYPREHFSQLKQRNTTVQLLKKPFSLHKLTQKVREVLDAS
ncbi:MAG: PAS domain S-box protein [Desulfuromusa sp.]|nr:PAS domain S-box protein [Desulfuromusa sp.]